MEITWQTKDGKAIKVNIALITNETIWADGDNVVVPCCKLGITANVEGMGIVGTGRPQAINDTRCVARIGKLGITADNLARINAAIAEIEATPEWQEKLRRQEACRKADEDYEAHRREMKKIMGY